MISNIKVKDLIGKRDEIFYVDADDTAEIAALKLIKFRIRTIGVLKDGELVGVVGNNDLARKVVALGKHPSDVKVREIMTTNLRTVRLDSSIIECLNLMDKHHISHLIILNDDEKYFGMISWFDVQKKLVQELKNHIELLREYAFGPNCESIDLGMIDA
jgi:predicted transcriptional regulator